jgi:hypothetical protein
MLAAARSAGWPGQSFFDQVVGQECSIADASGLAVW